MNTISLAGVSFTENSVILSALCEEFQLDLQCKQ